MKESRRDSTASAAADGGHASATPPEELARLIAIEKERAQSAERRLAAQQALLDERLLRIEKNRLFSAWNTAASWIRHLWSGHGRGQSGPRQLQNTRVGYAAWVANEQAELPDPEVAILTSRSWSFRPLVSIVMRSGQREDEIATLRSIAGQLYARWNVYIGPTSGAAAAETELPARQLNFVSTLSDAGRPQFERDIAGEYVWIVEPGDLLCPHALYYMIEALQEHRHPVIYADEDLHHSGNRTVPVFKPDWSPHLLASQMYIGRAFLCATGCLQKFLPTLRDTSENWRHSLLLKLAATNVPVHHVSRVLYHRRTDSGSIEREEKQPRRRPSEQSRGGPALSQRKSVTVVICSRSSELVSKCLDSLNATAAPLIESVVVVAHETPGADGSLKSAIERRGAVAMPFMGRFNFSLMNNLAAQNARSRHLLFLNDDVTASASGWLELLVEQVEDRGAGIAGATLWYPSGLLQHAGIVSGIADGVGHIGRYLRKSVLWWPWLLETRDVSAVTGACLCIPAALFRSLGGFDTAFPTNYNDVDLCFRARAAGHSVVCVATSALIHAECASRRGVVRFEERHRFFRKWNSLLSRTDPYYSPHLAPTETIQLEFEEKSGGFGPLLRDDQDP